MKAMKWLLLVCCVLSLTACDRTLVFLAGEGWQPHGQAFSKTNWQGEMADSSSFVTVVARNEAEWQNLWERVGAKAPAPLPAGKMAVAVMLGQRPSPDYSVDIISATRQMQLGRAERVVVKYIERRKAGDATHASQLASPWAIRLTDATDVTPEFIEVKPSTRAR